MIQANIAIVKIGNVEIEGLMDENGAYYVAMPQIADEFQIARHQASRDFINRLRKFNAIDENFKLTKIKTPLSPKAVNAVPVALLERFINIIGQNAIKQKLSKPVYRQDEYDIKLEMQQLLGGQVEVKTPVGRIDLLTDTQLIEIKRASDWKNAMGQVMAYGYYYPSHQKRIHLFAPSPTEDQDLIESVCSTYGIIVTWD